MTLREQLERELKNLNADTTDLTFYGRTKNDRIPW